MLKKKAKVLIIKNAQQKKKGKSVSLIKRKEKSLIKDAQKEKAKVFLVKNAQQEKKGKSVSFKN